MDADIAKPVHEIGFTSSDAYKAAPLDKNSKREIRKTARIAKTLAAQGRWRKILQITSAGNHATRPEILKLRLHAAIEVGDAPAMIACLPPIMRIDDPSGRVIFAAMLVNAHRPIEAASILQSIPSEYGSVKTSNVVRRIRATTTDITIRNSVRHLSTKAADVQQPIANERSRFPGDIGSFSIPNSSVNIVRMPGVDKAIEKFIDDLCRQFKDRVNKRPHPFIKTYENVYIDKLGRISNEFNNRDLVPPIVPQSGMDSSAPVRVFDEAFSCLGGNKGYYEWIVDRLAVLSWRLSPETPNCPILLRKEQYNLALDALLPIGVDRADILDFDGIAFCKKLYVGSSSNVALARKAAYQHSYGRLMEEAIRTDNGMTPRRFYISRRDTKRRAMSNEVEFEQAMVEHGITPVLLSRLSLIEKINLFRNAELVVGAHGAGLSHLVFGNPGLRVIELMPAALSQVAQMNIRTCFLMISIAFGLDHTMILYPASPKVDGWTADEALIESVISQAGGR